MNYYLKYLKYKNKYFKLKKQNGGFLVLPENNYFLDNKNKNVKEIKKKFVIKIMFYVL